MQVIVICCQLCLEEAHLELCNSAGTLIAKTGLVSHWETCILSVCSLKINPSNQGALGLSLLADNRIWADLFDYKHLYVVKFERFSVGKKRVMRVDGVAT